MKMDYSKPNPTRKAPAQRKKKSKMSGVTKIILILAAVALIISLVMGALVIRKYAKLKQETEEARELYNPTSQSTNGDTKKEVDPETGVIRDFAELFNINSDIRGWITIPDTGLDQPVVQSTDNEFYLYRNVYKEKSSLGIPFVDYRAFIGPEHISTNLTIYGHAAKNGTFFAPVKEYKDIDFYKKHPTINFNTVYGDGTYKIVGFFMEDIGANNKKMFNYHDKVDMDEKEFNSFVSEMDKRSYFKTGVDVQFGDQLITLSTCDEEVTKGTSTNFRVALVARKVRPGESAKVDTSKAVINKEMIMPDLWVSDKGKANPHK